MPIAVAHHDTAEGRAALRVAAHEAQVRSTDLLVLHIDEVMDSVPGEGAAERVQDAVRETLEEQIPGAWRVVVGTSGRDTAQALLDLTLENGAELLVIGSRRRSPVGKMLMGSTVQRVVLDSPVPVLVVKAPR